MEIHLEDEQPPLFVIFRGEVIPDAVVVPDMLDLEIERMKDLTPDVTMRIETDSELMQSPVLKPPIPDWVRGVAIVPRRNSTTPVDADAEAPGHAWEVTLSLDLRHIVRDDRGLLQFQGAAAGRPVTVDVPYRLKAPAFMPYSDPSQFYFGSITAGASSSARVVLSFPIMAGRTDGGPPQATLSPGIATCGTVRIVSIGKGKWAATLTFSPTVAGPMQEAVTFCWPDARQSSLKLSVSAHVVELATKPISRTSDP